MALDEGKALFGFAQGCDLSRPRQFRRRAARGERRRRALARAGRGGAAGLLRLGMPAAVARIGARWSRAASARRRRISRWSTTSPTASTRCCARRSWRRATKS